jgi:hypothetical protein
MLKPPSRQLRSPSLQDFKSQLSDSVVEFHRDHLNLYLLIPQPKRQAAFLIFGPTTVMQSGMNKRGPNLPSSAASPQAVGFSVFLALPEELFF